MSQIDAGTIIEGALRLALDPDLSPDDVHFRNDVIVVRDARALLNLAERFDELFVLLRTSPPTLMHRKTMQMITLHPPDRRVAAMRGRGFYGINNP